MKERAFASIKTLQDNIQAKKITPHESVSFFADRIREYDQDIGSVLEVFDNSVLADVNDNGPLLGVPGLIKDNICQKDQKTTCASNMLSSFVSPFDATVSERLKDAGAVSIGRANCD
jgi:aspartyl-tRNA(Asn)/glutamyl-tRNA(Gln) amidotransferase subunit A